MLQRTCQTGLLLALLAACQPSSEPVSEPAREPASEAAARPDIILIVVDTLRRDHLGAYGHPRDTSPSIDALARESVLYERAFSHAPWTTPSIGALLTSQYPTRLGITDESSVLSEDLWLLPEELARAGYRTGAVVSHSFCSTRWGFGQGFAEFDESNVLGHDAVTSSGVTDRAIEFLEAADPTEPADPTTGLTDAADAPRFLFAHYFDPHFTYVEHADHTFGGPAPGYAGRVRPGMLFSELRPLRKQLDAADLDELRRIYDSEIRHTDAEIGRLLQHLRATGRFENSLVILTADHGEAFMEHGYLGHAKRLHSTLIQVPLLIHYPGVGRAVVREPVGLVDVYPTVTAFLGLPAPEGLAGTPLFDPASQEHRAPEAVFSETDRVRSWRSIVRGDHKLILDANDGQLALFDITIDPAETRDLSNSKPETVRDLRERLASWLATQAPPAQKTEIEVDEAEQQRLKNLGYL